MTTRRLIDLLGNSEWLSSGEQRTAWDSKVQSHSHGSPGFTGLGEAIGSVETLETSLALLRTLDRSGRMSLSPSTNNPSPAQYQKDFAAWDLYQVGPDYTEELLKSAGVLRFPWRNEEALLQHYVGDSELRRKRPHGAKA
eukprot:Skav218646  [mRNA]  locus=scaffold365:568426:570308:- [translate_table: standard]